MAIIINKIICWLFKLIIIKTIPHLLYLLVNKYYFAIIIINYKIIQLIKLFYNYSPFYSPVYLKIFYASY